MSEKPLYGFRQETIKENLTGMGAILEILKLVEDEFYSPRIIDNCYYPRPALIFRGLDANYQTEDSNPTFDSVLCVRIRNSYKKDNFQSSDNETYVKANYLNSLSNIIVEAKKKCPEKYADKSDLHVLADIQHNGGATCLVDFSKNILISLFFATGVVKLDKKEKVNEKDNQNNTDKKEYSDGYLYCYNYIHDLIVSNNLSMVHSDDEDLRIQDLVLGTYTVLDYCSDSQNRFRLWDPVALNRRIVRQDSVFIFGIEKFYIHKHHILKITIPDTLKQKIRDTLADVFNITSESVFNDEAGIASSNGKFNVMKNHEQSFHERCYNLGFDCMIRGDYAEALELFKAYDIKKEDTKSPQQEETSDLSLSPRFDELLKEKRKKIELCFSLAVCYKNLAKEEGYGNIYYRNAAYSYNSAIRLIKSYKNLKQNQSPGTFLDDEEKQYYKRKILRAYNEIIELYYCIKDYKTGIEYCKQALNFISSEIEEYKSYADTEVLGKKYLKFTILELGLLDILKKSNCGEPVSNELIEVHNRAKRFHKMLEEDFQKNEFDYVLLDSIELIIDLIQLNGISSQNPTVVAEKCYKIIHFDFDVRTDITRCKIDTKYYMEWSFESLISAVQNCSGLTEIIKDTILDVIAHTISIRDLFNSDARIVGDSR